MKPGPAISTRSADVVEIGCGDDGVGDLPRRALQRLRKAHREIGLEVRTLGAAHHRIDVRVLGAEGFGHGRLQPSREHGSRIGAHGEARSRVGHTLGTANSSLSRPRSIRA